MTEAYLQDLWACKRFPVNNIQLVDGREIIIHEVGEHNKQLSGPDFFMGSISIDGIRFHGSIEIHIKASDWYRHKHHQDENYNNVILHVVFENDETVVQNGYELPTYELKNHIDGEHFEKYIEKKVQCQEFPCQNLLQSVDRIYLESMMSKALHQKLRAKSKVIEQSGLKNSFEVFYHLLGVAFGTSINKIPFVELLERVPFESIKHLSHSQRYRLLMTESGIIQAGTTGREAGERWHFRGARPHNFPTIRVKQFAFMTSRFDFELTRVFQNTPDVKNYFIEIIDVMWKEHGRDIPRLSNSFKNHLLINAVVPFLWYFGEKTSNDLFLTKAHKLLEEIPAEKNAIVRKWNVIGEEAKNAFESQALLAMHRYYCCRKKCLSCEVGNKIMNRSE